MKRVLLLASCVLVQIQALPAEEDAATLLKAVQTKAMDAKNLRVKCTLSMSKQNEDFARLSGETCAKGANQWLFDFTGKIKGRDEQFRGACDGDVLRMKGFKKGEERAYLADRYNRQLRAWSATSFVPIFMSTLYRDIDQGDDNLPAVSEVKSLGRQQLGATNTHVIEYLLTYPTQTKVRVKAWIDVDKLQPLKRESVFGMGIVEEVITSFELNPEIPDAAFVTQVTTLPSAQEKPTDTPTGPASTPVQDAAPSVAKGGDLSPTEADAQYELGRRYQTGDGMPRDPPEALKWFHKAAEQGYPPAQMSLGRCYQEGQGVVQSLPTAYMWWSLAAASGDFDLGQRASSLSSVMNEEQLREGREMLREWIGRHPDQKALLQAIPPGSTADDQAAVALLEGVWSATRVQIDGEAKPLTQQGGPLKLVIERERLAFTPGKTNPKFLAYRCDAGKSPKQMDLGGPGSSRVSREEERKMFAIYSLEGDTLKICIADATWLIRRGGRREDSVYPFADGSLTDLKIEGDSATAVAVTKRGDSEKRAAISFHRIDGGWRVALDVEQCLRTRRN